MVQLNMNLLEPLDNRLKLQQPPGHPKSPEITPGTPHPEQAPAESPEVFPQKSSPEIEPKQPNREFFPEPSPQVQPGEIPHEFPER